jgi:hypothetical protein
LRIKGTNPLNDTLLKCNNKADLVQKIIDLKKEAEQNAAKRAENYYLLGNVYYNMTQNGKAWLMSRIYSTNAPNCGIDKSNIKNLFKTENSILDDGKSVSSQVWLLILSVIAMLVALIWKKMFKIAFAAVGLGILGAGVYSYQSGRADAPKNYAFSKSNDDFFSCDRAKNWYLKAMKEDNSTIAAAACYMAGICEENNLMYQEDCRRLVTKDFKDDENQAKTPFKNPYIMDLQKRFGGKVEVKVMQSCKAYQTFLETL